MKKTINRFKALLVLWAVVLVFCAFISTNVYLNGFIIFCGILAMALAFGRVEKDMNDAEKGFFEKLSR